MRPHRAVSSALHAGLCLGSLATILGVSALAAAGPLHEAAKEGNLARIRQLLDGGADVDQPDGQAYEMTPLMWAAVKSDLKTVDVLLDAGAAINARDRTGRTALCHAMQNEPLRRRAIVSSLLQRGADPNATGGFAVEEALRASAEIEIFRLLLDRGLQVNHADAPWYDPLVRAAASERPDVIRLLLAAGADVPARLGGGRTPLMIAAVCPWCADAQGAETVRLLLEAGADVHATDEEGQTALHYAAEASGVAAAERIKVLLAAGAEVDAKNSHGQTPLMLAAADHFHIAKVWALLDAGADVSARDNGNKCVLSYAAAGGRVTIVDAMLARGADAGAADTLGWTPLMEAARCGSSDVLRRLCRDSAAADLDARNHDGWTALMIAVGAADRKVWFDWKHQEMDAFTHVPKQSDGKLEPQIGLSIMRASASQVERVWALLRRGADPDLAANDGTTIDALLEGRDDLDALATRALIELVRRRGD